MNNTKKNILAQYISQLYVITIGILIVPVHVDYLGIEAYGLVGLFTSIQVLFQMLDLGLTPTFAREATRYKAGMYEPKLYKQLISVFETIFLFIAVIGAGTIILFSESISNNWLNADTLSIDDLIISITLIGGIVAFRWFTGLYRAFLAGSEEFVLLSILNIVFTTFRFILVIPVLIYFEARPVIFFSFQLLVSIFELLTYYLFSYKFIPKIKTGYVANYEWKNIINILRFSGFAAFTGILWVIITQLDKILLSKLLSLSEYGLFSMVIVLVSGIMATTAPITRVLIPKLTKTYSINDNTNLINVYKFYTQLVSIIIATITSVFTFYSYEIVWVWTGDLNIATNIDFVVICYALGNGMLALSSFSYYLQYAKGNLKLHIVGLCFYFLTLATGLTYFSKLYGFEGAGIAWLLVNTLYLFIWCPIVHTYLVKGINKDWILNDILKIFILPFVIVFFSQSLYSLSSLRLLNVFELAVIAGLALVGAVLGSNKITSSLKKYLVNVVQVRKQ